MVAVSTSRRGIRVFDGFAAIVPASDMSRAKAFYMETLGLEGSEVYPDGSVRFDMSGTTMILYPSEFAGTNQATTAGFRTSDIAADVADFRSKGVEFHDLDYGEFSTVDGIMEMPGGGKAAWFTDPEGNVIGIFQEA
jgi:predicted enzyme related to lactoylglutathione lyase